MSVQQWVKDNRGATLVLSVGLVVVLTFTISFFVNRSSAPSRVVVQSVPSAVAPVTTGAADSSPKGETVKAIVEDVAKPLVDKLTDTTKKVNTNTVDGREHARRLGTVEEGLKHAEGDINALKQETKALDEKKENKLDRDELRRRMQELLKQMPGLISRLDTLDKEVATLTENFPERATD